MKRALILLLSTSTLVCGDGVWGLDWKPPPIEFIRVIILTPAEASPWRIPADFNNASNVIECFGRGGNGSLGTGSSLGGFGGGGGAYSIATNVNLGTPGLDADFQIGSSASAVPTWIKAAGGAIQVRANYGLDATTSAPGIGGDSIDNEPYLAGYPGGRGGTPTGTHGAGGGGAGGFNGEGSEGGPVINGGDADGSMLQGQTLIGEPGFDGCWVNYSTPCYGSGSGGAASIDSGGDGGRYGGGGGGGEALGSYSGIGSDGMIVITYGASEASPTPTPTATPSATATAGPKHKNKMFLAPRP